MTLERKGGRLLESKESATGSLLLILDKVCRLEQRNTYAPYGGDLCPIWSLDMGQSMAVEHGLESKLSASGVRERWSLNCDRLRFFTLESVFFFYIRDLTSLEYKYNSPSKITTITTYDLRFS